MAAYAEAVFRAVNGKLSDFRVFDDIRHRFEGLKSFLRDAEEKEKSGENVSKSMEQFLQIAYDLDGIVDFFKMQRVHHNRRSNEKQNPILYGIFRFIRCITPFQVSKADLNVLNEMEQMKNRIMALNTTLQLPIDGEIPESSSSRKHNDEDAGDDVPSHLRACLVYLAMFPKEMDGPSHLRACLVYLAMFPKEMDVPVRRLFHLWNADASVSWGPWSPWTAYDFAEFFSAGEVLECLAALEERGKVDVTRSDDGSVKTCRMRGDLYDIFSRKAQNTGLFYIHKKSTDGHSRPATSPQFAVRRVVECADMKDYPVDEFYDKYLRIYMSFNFQKKDLQALEIGIFLRKIIGKRGFALLRVLDLERVYKPHLPEELGNLYNLTYLGLRWTFLDTLPSSLANLLNLQTLDVKHTYIRSLPTFKYWLIRMRHLYLNQINQDFRGFRYLHTLSGLFMDKKSSVRYQLRHFVRLRKLGLTCHSSSTPELGQQISALTELQSLKLRSIDDNGMGVPSSLQLVSLIGLKNLTRLYLMGKLPKLEKPSFEFPPSLKDLTLSVSRLEDDPMPTLGRLPNLTVLRLLAHSFTGNKMVCEEGGFVSLRVLRLWVLENLEEWVVEKGAMLSLEKLEVRGCVKLKSLPASLLNSSRLKELTLTNMPREFVAVTEAKRQKQTSSVTEFEISYLI